jgi:zinc D-Ala-D-Ala carboxypeptidase
MGDLSEHFSRSEFACHGNGKAGHPPHPVTVDLELVGRLELLRSKKGGRPLRIVSGHRCAWWNRRVGGARSSQHLVGRAADIPPGYATESEARSVGFKGVGTKGAWAVHVDTRARAASWRY